MLLRIAPLEAASLPVLPPDVVWDGTAQLGDFVVATVPAQGGVGGYQAQNPIASAVMLLLASDMECPAAMLTLGLGGDRRGWPGDGFDIDTAHGEAPLGSLFWAMRRATLTPSVAAQFVAEAQRALAPLLAQQVCAAISVTIATLDAPNGLLVLAIVLSGTDGRPVFAGQYRPLWNRSAGL
jgi:phage gp46-like protein